MSKKKQYPISEGWMHIELKMKDKSLVSESEIKNFCLWGKPDTYEWGPIEQHGKKVTAIYRDPARIPDPSSTDH